MRLYPLSFLLADVIQRRKYTRIYGHFFSYIGTAVGTVALLGGFSHKHLPDISLLGQSSFNLNGLLNPQGWSQVLTSLPVYGVNSSEGLAFPGTGILLTLGTGAFACWLLFFIFLFLKGKKGILKIQWSWEEKGVAYLFFGRGKIEGGREGWVMFWL